MNKEVIFLKRIVGLLGTLILVTSVVLFIQLPPASPDMSKGLTEGPRPTDSFLPSYTIHDPIRITSDEDFESQGFPGNGTEEDPYVIEGYNITSTYVGIHIIDVEGYFVIRDCLLTGNSSGSGITILWGNHADIRNNIIRNNSLGIHLYSTHNTTVVNNTVIESSDGVGLSSGGLSNTVANNTLSVHERSVILWACSYNAVVNNTITGNSEQGVSLYWSDYNTIVENTVTGNSKHGMYLSLSSSNIIANNTLTGNSDNGVYLTSSSNNSVVSNIISENYRGVYFDSSWNNTLSSNIFVNDGIYISGDGVEYWRQNITTSNLVNGKVLGYFWNWTSGIIDGGQYGQVILVNCTGVTVENGVFNNATVGIELGYSSDCCLMNNSISENYENAVNINNSSNNTIANNRLSENYGDAVNIYNSLNNTIANNSISENYGDAVNIYNSLNNTIANNNISGNLGSGIFFYSSSNNSVTDNTIIENSGDGMVFHFFSSKNKVTANSITGNSNWGMYVFLNSDSNLIHLNVIAYNDDGNAYDDGTGNHWNTTGMGNYWSDYNGIGVYHITGRSGSIDYHPFLYDIISPTINQLGNIAYEEGTTDHSITWTPDDTYPSHYVIYLNGTETASASWDGSSITIDIDNLNVGIHNYTILVYDTSGNCAIDTVLVTVLPQTTTTTTTTAATTTTTSTTTPTPTAIPPFGVEMVIIYGVLIGIEVIVAVLIIKKYKRN